MTVCESGELSPRPESACTLSLNVPASRTMRGKCLFCGILLQQLQLRQSSRAGTLENDESTPLSSLKQVACLSDPRLPYLQNKVSRKQDFRLGTPTSSEPCTSSSWLSGGVIFEKAGLLEDTRERTRGSLRRCLVPAGLLSSQALLTAPQPPRAQGANVGLRRVDSKPRSTGGP